MTKVLAAATSTLLFIAAANAKTLPVKDPVAATKAHYAQIEKDNFDGELPFSARLKALEALDAKETPKDEVGRIDGDIYVNAQDMKVTNVVVTSRNVENAPNRKIVVVRFKNYDEQEEMHLFWEKTKAGWVVDDIRALGDDGWTLSLMLKYGWDGPEELEKKASGQ